MAKLIVMKSLSEIKKRYNSLSLLPGREAQIIMMPKMRVMDTDIQLKESAVTILCYEGSDDVHLLLIRRVEDGLVHGNQMALPGGGVSMGESLEMAALRELGEEVGAELDFVEFIGPLTSLPIPISGFMVNPFLAFTTQSDGWRLQESEVKEIYAISLSELLDPARSKVSSEERDGIPAHAPFYLLEGQKVWGATAMILAEFKAIIS